MINYEIVVDSLTSKEVIKRINEDNSESWIPKDEGNADYQAYLEHLTENPTEDVE